MMRGELGLTQVVIDKVCADRARDDGKGKEGMIIYQVRQWRRITAAKIRTTVSRKHLGFSM